MKQCPACKTTYTDQTLRFCLADGAILADLDEEQSTLIRKNPTIISTEETVAMNDLETVGGMRSETPRNLPPTIVQPMPASSGGIFKIFMIVIGFGIFLILAAAAGAFIYFNLKDQPQSSNINQKTIKAPIAPSPSPTKDETDELREQIANLEKLVREQKSTGGPANMPLPIPTQSSTVRMATANSPRDGFLALRSLPNSEIGERILKIPHGARVNIGACGPMIRPVIRSGRWCQATYDGRTGWVFDAFVEYEK